MDSSFLKLQKQEMSPRKKQMLRIIKILKQKLKRKEEKICSLENLLKNLRYKNQWPTPTTVRKIRQFLGMASWYRRFIGDFFKIAAPLTQLTRKNARWRWGPEEEGAFQQLKQALNLGPGAGLSRL